MSYGSVQSKVAFDTRVSTRYDMYNSLFMSLPFQKVERTGIYLALFQVHCEEGLQNGKNPTEIIDSFFEQNNLEKGGDERQALLLRFIQYCERQVVLFDALEDAAFPYTNNLNGSGTLNHLLTEAEQSNQRGALAEHLKGFCVRLVLTAHPTQFYPSEVLGIIHDLASALEKDDSTLVRSYLEQLGRTSFFKKSKPTPLNEAKNLIWFLEKVFYKSAGDIRYTLKRDLPGLADDIVPVQLGFWPGGDRDGNPFVTSDTTIKVTKRLRRKVLDNYRADIAELKKRLTFSGVREKVVYLLKQVDRELRVKGGDGDDITQQYLLDSLGAIRTKVNEEHSGLFVEFVDRLLCKVELFGLYFASLDIRQDSSVHEQLIDTLVSQGQLPAAYKTASEEERINTLLTTLVSFEESKFEDPLCQDVVESIAAMEVIQNANGEAACHRYIISHTTSALNLIEVLFLFKSIVGLGSMPISVDVVPLFETIDDLSVAGAVMEQLFSNEVYRAHVKSRGNKQTIMLGFSDGTKDGGYLMANWSIIKAKMALTDVAEKHGISILFFDGRGGPPARGGGETHEFYASQGNDISESEIQLTIQGQTISSNFGTVESARFNIEQLIHAGCMRALNPNIGETITEHDKGVLKELSEISYEAYVALKSDPVFLDYVAEVTPLKYYSETNIGSRPSKRAGGALSLDSLRAVPYVGSWSQIKQNLPGFFGVGTALKAMDDNGRFAEAQALYQNCPFFKALISNCEMAMKKCFFPLTAHLKNHPKYGALWQSIYDEFQLSKKYVLALSGAQLLMESKPVGVASVELRQKIELPLLVIQQYALMKVANEDNAAVREELEHLIVRCAFGIINAERNSA